MIKIQNVISYFTDIAMAHQIVLTAQMNTKNVYVTKVKIEIYLISVVIRINIRALRLMRNFL